MNKLSRLLQEKITFVLGGPLFSSHPVHVLDLDTDPSNVDKNKYLLQNKIKFKNS